jgi:hypothetical protein
VAHHHLSEDVLRDLVESRDADEQFTIHLTNTIPFAMEALEALRAGRAFDVRVRGDDDAVTVSIA